MKKENQVLFRIMAELVLLLALMTDVLVTVLFSLFKINVEAMTSLDFNQLFSAVYAYECNKTIYYSMANVVLFCTIGAILGLLFRVKGSAYITKYAAISGMCLGVLSIIIYAFQANSKFQLFLLMLTWDDGYARVRAKFLNPPFLISGIIAMLLGILIYIYTNMSQIGKLKVYYDSRLNSIKLLIPIILATLLFGQLIPYTFARLASMSRIETTYTVEVSLSQIMDQYVYMGDRIFAMPAFILFAYMILDKAIKVKLKRAFKAFLLILTSLIPAFVEIVRLIINSPKILGQYTGLVETADSIEATFLPYIIMRLSTIVLLAILVFITYRQETKKATWPIIGIYACLSLILVAVSVLFFGISVALYVYAILNLITSIIVYKR